MNTNNKNSSRAFEGIRVVEFAVLIAGPSCGKYLADHGADVIKVERYPLGDIAWRYRAALEPDERGAEPHVPAAQCRETEPLRRR